MVGVGFRCGWLVGGAFPGVAAAVGQRRGWPTVFLRAVSADQCGFSCAVISRRLPKLVESLIAPKLLLTALFSFLSRQSYLRYIFFFFSVSTRELHRLEPFFHSSQSSRAAFSLSSCLCFFLMESLGRRIFFTQIDKNIFNLAYFLIDREYRFIKLSSARMF